MRRRRLKEFAGLAQGSGAAAAGRADARKGGGYFSSSGTSALNHMRGYPEGYPYMDDLSSLGDEYEDEDEGEPEDVDMAVKVSQSSLTRGPDAKPQRDRRAGLSNPSSRSFASSNALTFSEATYGIGIRPRTSDGVQSGTPHGWSKAPQSKKPFRTASPDNYRFEDIVDDDEEKDFEELSTRHFSVDEAVLRQFIRTVLTE